MAIFLSAARSLVYVILSYVVFFGPSRASLGGPSELLHEDLEVGIQDAWRIPPHVDEDTDSLTFNGPAPSYTKRSLAWLKAPKYAREQGDHPAIIRLHRRSHSEDSKMDTWDSTLLASSHSAPAHEHWTHDPLHDTQRTYRSGTSSETRTRDSLEKSDRPLSKPESSSGGHIVLSPGGQPLGGTAGLLRGPEVPSLGMLRIGGPDPRRPESRDSQTKADSDSPTAYDTHYFGGTLPGSPRTQGPSSFQLDSSGGVGGNRRPPNRRPGLPAVSSVMAMLEPDRAPDFAPPPAGPMEPVSMPQGRSRHEHSHKQQQAEVVRPVAMTPEQSPRRHNAARLLSGRGRRKRRPQQVEHDQDVLW